MTTSKTRGAMEACGSGDTTEGPPPATLPELAAQAGISTSYTDGFGVVQKVPDEHLRTILAALGIEAAMEHGAGASAGRVGGNAQDSCLPPVAVVRGDALDPHVALRGGDARSGRWHLAAEGGDRQSLSPVQHEGRWVLALPPGLPIGYYRLSAEDTHGQCLVIVAPPRCWVPTALLDGDRWWGPCVQVYALRSSRNWGMGDFNDLRCLARTLAAQGASFIGVNPLHALFMQRPDAASPYSPSSRAMLNPAYIDAEAVPELEACPAARALVDGGAFRARIEKARAAAMVDYAEVLALKLEVLELLWSHFREQHLALQTPRADTFSAYCEMRGQALRDHSLAEALQAHFTALDPAVWGWPAWPEAYRTPSSERVLQFAQERPERLGFYAWLQWLADTQLEAVQETARASGMELGLYRDLAVGVHKGGTDTWREPAAYVTGVHIGTPPDPYNTLGQDWGLPPYNPLYLREKAYGPFIGMIQDNMRHAGALRLDHAMALMRLFWRGPAGGAYVSYPREDLLGIVALESHRNHCMVIGEDLGDVDPAMRKAMADSSILSYRPLLFERGENGSFQPPSRWPRAALATVGTHDLPTLRGFWTGLDIDLQAELGLQPDAEARSRAVLDRARDRVELLLALEREALLPHQVTIHSTTLPDVTPPFVEAVYGFLARTPSMLVGIQLEDIALQRDPVNVPGTTEAAHPNWRRKLPLTIEDLATHKTMLGVAALLQSRRGSPIMAPAVGAMGLPQLSTAHIPGATYRIQFHAGMRFDQATALVPYLQSLGVSHLYASPYLRARAGSTHGYDIVDHSALNPEIGDEQAYARLCQALKAAGMSQILDIVPNHMGVLQADNAWWLDVLENGAAADHAATFDIEWQPAAPELANKVLLPVLGDHYGVVLENGDLQVQFDADVGEFWLHYFEHRFPLDPSSYPDVFAVLPMPAAVSEEQRDSQAIAQSLLHALASLPPQADAAPEARVIRNRDRPLHKRGLARLAAREPWFRSWVRGCLSAMNGAPGEARSFDQLDALLTRQAYRLAFWRVAGDDINYRRFFDVNTLAGLRAERREVFEATHQRIFHWLGNGSISALRVDHPDGLADPQGYFERLQARYARVTGPTGAKSRAVYVVVEKILDFNEPLPPEWPVHGDTGYRFGSLTNGLFVQPANASIFDRLYAEFTGERGCFDDVVYDAKNYVIENVLSSELAWLTETLYRISRSDRRTRDFTRNRLHKALAQVAASFPVYRTYIRDQDKAVRDADREVIDQAVGSARRRSSGEEIAVLDFFRSVLLGACAIANPRERQRVLRFVTRWQQFTAPVMAKAMEDTAFYRYNRLVSLNDVGSDPRRFGVTVEDFHAANRSAAASHPHSMLGTSTHDSKRAEDIRARIDVLSEVPEGWGRAVARWSAAMEPFRISVNGAPAPSRNDEWLFWQTLVGAWPHGAADSAALGSLRERMLAYMSKASREAKCSTSWLSPNEAYEAAVESFVNAVLDENRNVPLLQNINDFVNDIAPFGYRNSLALVCLKLTSPGVADIYQGSEQWNFSLVDPDNRRPVDFDRLAAGLEQIRPLYQAGFPSDADWTVLLDGMKEGLIKQLVTWRLLQLRKLRPEIFLGQTYTPLQAGGLRACSVVAYQRGTGSDAFIVVAGRLLRTATDGLPTDERLPDKLWGSTEFVLPDDVPLEMVEWFTGCNADLGSATNTRTMQVSRLFRRLPIAVLVPRQWLGSRSPDFQPPDV